MVRSFRDLGAWRGGMELVVLVFDLTAGPQRDGRDEARDDLRLAALEVPQRIAAGAMDGQPRQWLRCLAQARAALDRLEEEAGRLRVVEDHRLAELMVRVRRELLALQGAAVPLLGAEAANGPGESVEIALGEAA